MLRLIILLTVAVVAAVFFIVPPAEGLGNLVRMIYLHIPTAWVSVVAFLTGVVYAIKYLKNKNLHDDEMSAKAAKLGLTFVIISTVSGAVFSKLTWGAYWNWDPRQTSIMVLILIYGAYLTLRAAVKEVRTRAKVCAIYTILANSVMPFLMFIMPRLYFSLHPSPIINSSGLYMDSTMLAVLVAAIVDTTLIFAYFMKWR